MNKGPVHNREANSPQPMAHTLDRVNDNLSDILEKLKFLVGTTTQVRQAVQEDSPDIVSEMLRIQSSLAEALDKAAIVSNIVTFAEEVFEGKNSCDTEIADPTANPLKSGVVGLMDLLTYISARMGDLVGVELTSASDDTRGAVQGDKRASQELSGLNDLRRVLEVAETKTLAIKGKVDALEQILVG